MGCLVAALLLAACGGASDAPSSVAAAPGTPAEEEGVNFTAPDPDVNVAPPPPLERQNFRADTRASGKPSEITWDNLLPAGEEDALAEMYEAFYLELDRKLRGSQTQLNAPSGAWSPADLEEGGELDKMPQFGTFNTVPELDGKYIRIPAYITPLDFSASSEHSEFLLVPYFGACIHSPPPPPNQIIYVTAEPAARIANIWGPVWAEGVLTAQKKENEIGNAAYTLQLTKIEPYED